MISGDDSTTGMPTLQNRSDDTSRRPWLFACLMVVLGGLSTPSFATHDVQHRYIVSGYVRDAQGAPMANTLVEITLIGGQPAGEGRTDRSGRYSILIHAHNEAAGRRYWVTANGVTHAASFDFDPNDTVTERGRRIDFSPE